jgi:hypothetical protein
MAVLRFASLDFQPPGVVLATDRGGAGGVDLVDHGLELGVALEFAGQGVEHHVRQYGAIEGGQQGDRHGRSDRTRILEIAEHLDQADQSADQAHGRGDLAGAAQHAGRALVAAHCLAQLAVQDARHFLRRQAVDHHFHRAPQVAAVIERRQLGLQGEHAALARQVGQAEHFQRRLLGHLGAVEHGAQHDLLRAQHFLEREGDRRDQEGAAQNDQHAGQVEEAGGRAAQDHGRADHGEAAEHADQGREVDPRGVPRSRHLRSGAPPLGFAHAGHGGSGSARFAMVKGPLVAWIRHMAPIGSHVPFPR